MESINNVNNLFSPENLKYVEINGVPANKKHLNNFISGIQSIKKLLNGLEQSINKSNRYEKRLLRCKSSHAHSHSIDLDVGWDTEVSEEQNEEHFKGLKNPSNNIDITSSWSTVSIVCLQYQYEELSKRYEGLLREYDERSATVNKCNASVYKLQQRLKSTREQLTNAHKDLLAVGDKYLSLRRKRNKQKGEYELKILMLKETLHKVYETAERARINFDSQLAECLAEERNSDIALLLFEIRKCNQLFLENLRLKTRMEGRPAENFK